MDEIENDRLTTRCDQLFNLGMVFNGSGYIGNRHYNKDFNVSVVEIQCDEDAAWNEKVAKIKQELNKRLEEM